jgi:GT2 family glycosyltransferase
MNDSKPKVSVITFVNVNATNGRYELLEEALQSVAEQKFHSYEHLIVDDGSSVDIETLCNRYPNTRYIFKPGSGITTTTTTFNLGHLEANGEYCIYLASDDLHLPGAIEALSNELDDQPSLVAVCGRAYHEYATKTVEWIPNFDDIKNRIVTEGNIVSGCAVMWRNSTFADASVMPPNASGYCSDYDIWVRLAEAGPMGTIDHHVVNYRERPDSTRHKTKKKYFLSARPFDRELYQYSKNSRLRYVKNSALKRRAGKVAEPVDKPYLVSDIMTEHSFENSTAIKDSDPKQYVGNFSELFFDQRAVFDVHAPLLGDTVTKLRNTLVESIKLSSGSDLSEVLDSDSSVCVDGVSGAAVWLSWCCRPNKKLSLSITNADRDNFYYDYINWAFVDEIVCHDSDIGNEIIKYLGLQGCVTLTCV